MASRTKEIVTVQAGHYSNFVGTHWWNLQEAGFIYDERQTTNINNDIFFREGRNRQGEETYLPRAVVIDLKGSLNTLKEDGDCYKDTRSSAVVWDGTVSIHKQEQLPKNEFLRDIEDDEKEEITCKPAAESEDQPTSPLKKQQVYNLDDDVNVWSDFLQKPFHPRSLYIIKEFNHLDSEGFGLFDSGAQLWSSCNVSEEIEDKIRYFAEECDYLQGFHLLVDGDNGFSALGSGISAYMQEEYPRKDIVAFPTFPFNQHDGRQNLVRYLYNTTFVLERLSSYCLTVPLSLASSFGSSVLKSRQFKHISYAPALNYHTSALLACGLDACTLPYRLRQNSLSLQDVVASLNVSNMKIASASLGFPFSSRHDNVVDTIEELESSLFASSSLTCGIAASNENVIFQTLGFKGLNYPKLDSASSLANRTVPKYYECCRTPEEFMAKYISRHSSNSVSFFKSSQDYCNTAAPFPNIFSAKISQVGEIMFDSRPDGLGVEKVPMLGGIHCTLNMQQVLNTLCKDSVKLKSNKLVCGIENDEFEEIINNLKSLASCYSYGND